MRSLGVPENILFFVHLSSVARCPQFVCCTVFDCTGRSTPLQPAV